MRWSAATFALALFSSASAWIDTGHMVVSAVAEPDLSPVAKREADRLLRIGGDERTQDFLGAACWADDTKTSENGPWHYINFHFRSDGASSALKPEKENVLTAIQRFSAVLKDRSRPDAERADALRYVLHFVGDVHMPLHAVARDSDAFPGGDRGGNEFKFNPALQISGFEVRNLHFLWDIAGGLYGASERPLSNRTPIDSIAARLRREMPRTALPELAAVQPELWARESADLARSTVYALEEGKRPSDAYLAVCRFHAERRLVLAGYRLADLLNRVLQ